MSDLISLEDAIEVIASVDITDGTEPVFSGKQVIALLKDLDIINPQEPKTGHWIKSNVPNEEYVCSECGGGCWYYDYQADVAKSRYCPNCGCRMIEPQESEDKE